MNRRCHCQIIPPFMLEHIAAAQGAAATRTLRHDHELRAARAERTLRPTAAASSGLAWTVHSAVNGTRLPGPLVRSAGQSASGDPAVDEAADGGQAALDLFRDVYGRDSFDAAGAEVIMSVHYSRKYDNAFWNGEQLVFGDGDGTIFDRFTKPVDVLGHELTHAVTERTAGLVYRDQPGALNESISDVFGICTKQRQLGHSVDQADWLIGANLFMPGVNARGLRDMANPGTAYDDPQLGKDPQPAHMDDYDRTSADNGGVHINSGIPNRAFFLAAGAIGGTAWDGAGAIWYAALTGPNVTATTDFAGFAAATIAAAGDHAAAVRDAWRQVGVGAATAPPGAPPQPSGDDAAVVAVRRSGGITGRQLEGRVYLDSDDPRVPQVRGLVEHIDLAEVQACEPYPDVFVYAFNVCGSVATNVPEPALTPPLRELADVVLRGM
jgi:Zn-dependent metalloprotease